MRLHFVCKQRERRARPLLEHKIRQASFETMLAAYCLRPSLFESGRAPQASGRHVDWAPRIVARRLASFHDRLQSASHPSEGPDRSFLNNFVDDITQLP
ncbi:hypothetical protein [Enterovirga sp.]|uniref:hypothetical protein n=1 Tax=Enterovirga sp. TaxID=2026350 RepID=UPI002B5FFAF8|nr:hypothetical protein [Enterovirga sp.]HMO27791.1 hypothetical protein [Enterovirga sp.]